jgi:putative nucleotidyltransferase with HDIG domain
MLHVETPDHAPELNDVPTDRRVALRLLWLLDDPYAPLDEISRVVSADPALTIRVLALANASFFRDAGGTVALTNAVALLGEKTVHSVASTAVLDLFSNRREPPDHFWLHAVTAGVAAARVAVHLEVDPAAALTVALLHDFGESLLYQRDPDRFDEMVRTASAEPAAARLALETDVFGVDHATLGARVLSSNGLPLAITNAVREHHVGVAGAAADPMTRVVQIADCIAEVVDGSPTADPGAVLRAAEVTAAAERLVDQAEGDRTALLNFLADFMTPRAALR